jgi:hypothetical protein
MSEETAEAALEYVAMYLNHAASTCALRAGMQQRRIFWPWRGTDPHNQRHSRDQEASPERVRLCRRYAALVVAAINDKAPV